ncbi:DUF4227 family protein [Oceanobacillus sp. J11TS1]|uniref:DUF4227 family protein n=1 Tax=Oceanobacillus sp. J11TS1 TaxID=2807191 RepID=UPI001AFD67BF|nr:DUF4227 family protein [Oceanobacillus sp. J11TS1]GIO22542.1 hypothetical protein J11TS1_11230 [Oceanobacillus sp. J11TS1]
MEKHLKDGMKLFIWFMIGACFFTGCLHFMYREFQEIHRYDPPEGPAVKVMNQEVPLFDWFPFDFMKGE